MRKSTLALFSREIDRLPCSGILRADISECPQLLEYGDILHVNVTQSVHFAMPIHMPSVNNKGYSTLIIAAACSSGSARGIEKIRGTLSASSGLLKRFRGFFVFDFDIY